MPADPVDVIWEVATDERFRSVVARGVTTTSPDDGHAVHVDVTALEPATAIPLPVHGRRVHEPARPHPDAAASGSPDGSGIAVANCQCLETGALRRLPPDRSTSRPRPRAAPRRLRLRVRGVAPGTERGPRDAGRLAAPATPRYRDRPTTLRAAHARFPFVCTWDDHEVANNYMGDVLEEARRPAGRPRAQGRRLPGLVGAPAGTDVGPPEGSDLGVVPGRHHRRPRPHPRARRAPGRRRAAVPRAADARRRLSATARPGSARTARGSAPTQEEWLAEAPGRGRRDLEPARQPGRARRRRRRDRRRAGVLPRHVGRVPRRPHPGHRAAGRVDNPVVLTGDYHAAWCSTCTSDPFDGHAGRCTGAHGAADLVAAVPGRRDAPGRRSCASSSTPTATSPSTSSPSVSPPASRCSTT